MVNIHFHTFYLFSGDHTRVKLMTKEGGDYINANLIKVRKTRSRALLLCAISSLYDLTYFPALYPTERNPPVTGLHSDPGSYRSHSRRFLADGLGTKGSCHSHAY